MNDHTKFSRKWAIVTGIGVVAIAALAMALVYLPLASSGAQNQAQAQDASLGEVLRSIRPIDVQAVAVNDKLSIVNGIPLTEATKNTTSETTEEINGAIKSVFKDGQAEIAILRGTNIATQDNIIAFRLTNTGTASFKIVELMVEGQTKSGYIPLQASAVSEGNFDKSNIATTDAVLLDPGESMTGYIVGKWKATEINEDVNEFRAGAVYRYENADGSVKVWSISTDVYRLS